eukprot:TRINITY_DN4418_c0_g1_i1.p1 TRINITY_DN4418_c0_g1~~TRINITY_DN4418_c0_g1_i1.p1  ORF type:complete len:360 (-),score=82.38 TRINITY_DN4418_c0_g1_i1:125-1204(-)
MSDESSLSASEKTDAQEEAYDIQSLSVQKQCLEKQLVILRQQLQVSENSREMLGMEIEGLQEELKNSDNTVKEVRQEREKVQRSLQLKEQQVEKLQEECNNQRNQIQQASQDKEVERQQMEQKMQELVLEKEAVRIQLEEMKNTVVLEKARLSELQQQRCQEAEDQLGSTRQNLVLKEEKIYELESLLKNMEKERDEIQCSYQQQCATFEQQSLEERRQQADLKNQYQLVSEQLEFLKKQQKAEQEERGVLVCQLDSMKQENSQLLSKIQNLNDQLVKFKSDQEGLEKLVDEKENLRMENMQERSALLCQLDTVKLQNSQLISEVQELNGQLMKCKSEFRRVLFRSFFFFFSTECRIQQ